jgi:HK97 family phage prohead protease
MDVKNLIVTIEKSTSADYDARFVMSASSPDRVKDTIDPDAYLPNIGKKIIALWQHDSDKPFGFWHNLRVEAGKMIGDLKVSSTNLGLMIKQLLADDVPLGASIGFRGKGDPNKIGGIHFRELDILECSVVSVPAHPRAMQIAKQFDIDLKSIEVGNGVASDASTAARKRAVTAIIGAKRAIKGKLS